MKKASSTAIWLFVFIVLVAVEAFSAFGAQASPVGTSTNGSITKISSSNRVTESAKLRRARISALHIAGEPGLN